MDTNELMKEALAYHAEGGPGKIEIRPTKPDATQYDLSLAYSPGVAAPCLAIADDPAKAYDYTIKGNLVAVITNGTAVLGLGDIGPLAAKPVMEGKCMLFKHFSGINAFDIEIDTTDPEEFIAAVKRIAPTFGGINLEDIKAPECFEIERRLVEELDIPVMHDDQHGTAIIASAALINAMHLSGKHIDEAQIVVNGAGAAAIACARMFLRARRAPRPDHDVRQPGRSHDPPHRPQLRQARIRDRPAGHDAARSARRRRRLPGRFRRPACSTPTWCGRWPATRWSWRWRIPIPKSPTTRPRRHAPT